MFLRAHHEDGALDEADERPNLSGLALAELEAEAPGPKPISAHLCSSPFISG